MVDVEPNDFLTCHRRRPKKKLASGIVSMLNIIHPIQKFNYLIIETQCLSYKQHQVAISDN